MIFNMTQKEKARAYDEAVEKLRNAFYDNNSRMCEEYRNAVLKIIEPIFPELAESDDEKIRKALIRYFTLSDEHAYNEACGVSYRDIVAWLEKQGEKETIGNDKEIPFSEKKPTWSEKDDEMLDSIIEEVRYIGDFPDYPTKEENELYDECLAKVDFLKSLKDRVQPKPRQEWSEEDEKISNAIIKKLIGSSDALCVDLQSAIGWVENIKDRVQPKREWNEDDALKIDFVSKLLNGLDQEKYDSQCMKELSSWLQSLKGRVQPKQEWSEEDERIISDIDNCIKNLPIFYETIKINGEDKITEQFVSCARNWLKSIRPQSQWKPSDEQIKGIECAIKTLQHQLNVGDKRLNSLYDDLKKLREE